MAKIEVIIDKKGNASIDITGVEGMGCQSISDKLTAALGTVEDVQIKPEYYVELDTLEQYQQLAEDE